MPLWILMFVPLAWTAGRLLPAPKKLLPVICRCVAALGLPLGFWGIVTAWAAADPAIYIAAVVMLSASAGGLAWLVREPWPDWRGGWDQGNGGWGRGWDPPPQDPSPGGTDWPQFEREFWAEVERQRGLTRV